MEDIHVFLIERTHGSLRLRLPPHVDADKVFLQMGKMHEQAEEHHSNPCQALYLHLAKVRIF